MTEQRRNLGLKLLCQLLFLSLSLIAVPGTLSADLYVSTTGRDVLSSGIVNQCATTSVPCRTINHAIEQSSSGDVIKAAIGEYNENVVLSPLVDFSLDIQGGWKYDFSERNIEQYYQKSMIRVSSGSAISINGSGIDLEVAISGFMITGGDAGSGGGIYFYSAGGGTKTLNIYGNVINENQAGENGGGVFIFDHSGDLNLTLSSNIITANHVDTGGGGGLRVYTVFPEATIGIINNVFYGNTSGYGGAISFHVTGAGTLSADMTNNTITGNSVTNSAGGLHFSALTHASASLDIQNTIIWGNTAVNNGRDLYVEELDQWGDATTVVNASYSNIDDVYVYNGAYNNLGHNINRNPRLENAGENDFHLMRVSPAINAGVCGEWINFGPNRVYYRIAPYSDFEADPRCLGFLTTGCCDIGADESPYPSYKPSLPGIPLLLLED